jgi:hypothetical protein
MDDWKSIDPRSLPIRQASPSRRNVSRWVIATLVGVAYFWFVVLRSPVSHPEVVSKPLFSWEDTPPSKSLEYRDCGDGFQCARLEVPMDYNRSNSESRKFTLAVVRLPARVPVADPRYGGAILINPGESICTAEDKPLFTLLGGPL